MAHASFCDEKYLKRVQHNLDISYPFLKRMF